MNLTFNRRTALFLMRRLRANRTPPSSWGKRADLGAPHPSPRKRWTRKLIEHMLCDLEFAKPGAEFPIDVATPSRSARLEMSGAHSTVYASERSLPSRSFIEIGQGIRMSCPELTFIEMATVLDPARHLVLGHELCGGFSRNPEDPRNGLVTLNCPPVTSCAKIETYLQRVRWNSAAKRAQQTLERLADNAWSPTESIVAAMASLPASEWGYEMGRCRLNVRVDTPQTLKRVNDKSSRVPDILFGDTPVGINYDGAVHLDLDSVVRAAIELERNPGSSESQRALDAIVREVRAKAVDDIRRNRELVASGFIVFPVTKEDLYEEGGLDRVMLQAISAIEEFAGTDLSEQKRLLSIEFSKGKRQQLIWSLLPGQHDSRIPRRLASQQQECRVIELEIGF